VLFDAVYIPGGKKSVGMLQENSKFLKFINEAFKHCKAIAVKAEDLQLKPEDVASSRSRVTALPTILNLDQLERVAVKKALAKHGFNISKTAAELGLTRASLYRRMEKHDL
jgi:catalase